jgi:hypothetical protein
MGRPYRPVRELEAHLARGELEFALALARAIAVERERPLELAVTVRFLPLIASERPEDYDLWTLRWLERWCGELGRRASIDDALEIVQGLAEIPVDPERGLETIKVVSASLIRSCERGSDARPAAPPRAASADTSRAR